MYPLLNLLYAAESSAYMYDSSEAHVARIAVQQGGRQGCGSTPLFFAASCMHAASKVNQGAIIADDVYVFAQPDTVAIKAAVAPVLAAYEAINLTMTGDKLKIFWPTRSIPRDVAFPDAINHGERVFGVTKCLGAFVTTQCHSPQMIKAATQPWFNKYAKLFNEIDRLPTTKQNKFLIASAHSPQQARSAQRFSPA